MQRLYVLMVLLCGAWASHAQNLMIEHANGNVSICPRSYRLSAGDSLKLYLIEDYIPISRIDVKDPNNQTHQITGAQEGFNWFLIGGAWHYVRVEPGMYWIFIHYVGGSMLRIPIYIIEDR